MGAGLSGRGLFAAALVEAFPHLCEHPLDEVVAEPRIGQPFFLLDGPGAVSFPSWCR